MMNNGTKLFLVLLRLAIGWLFLVEGYEKVKSFDFAPTGLQRPWSSAGYLRESSGPARDFFQWQAGGDADALARERLTLTAADPTKPPRHRLAPALVEDWRGAAFRFQKHYGLNEEQKALVQEALDRNLDRAAEWLAGTGQDLGAKDVEDATWPTASFKVARTFAQRADAYKKKLDEIRQLQNDVFGSFAKDVAGPKLRALKAEAAKMRTELMADLEAPLKADLEKIPLTDEQKKAGAVPGPALPSLLKWVDRTIAYGLLVCGGCLVLGLFTRLNSVFGALFLLMLYAAMPPWPWLPEVTRVEGHYLFVNKNLILALGLLVLATTRSGRWFGLDAVLGAITDALFGSDTKKPAAAR